VPVVIPASGLSPAGLFVAQKFVDPSKPPGILADAIDPKTNDYASIAIGMDPIDSQVIVALSVKRASGAAVLEDGHTFAEIRKVDTTTPAAIEARTRLTLKRLVEQRDIQITALVPTADPDHQSGWVEFQYRNRRARGPVSRTLRIMP
jgi:hypothetical protein